MPVSVTECLSDSPNPMMGMRLPSRNCSPISLFHKDIMIVFTFSIDCKLSDMSIIIWATESTVSATRSKWTVRESMHIMVSQHKILRNNPRGWHHFTGNVGKHGFSFLIIAQECETSFITSHKKITQHMLSSIHRIHTFFTYNWIHEFINREQT